jgi:tetratricopeptide (TPR) repeat protein
LKLSLSELAIENKLYDIGIKTLDIILNSYPLDREALYLKGIALFETEKWEEALLTFKLADNVYS